MHTSEVSRSVDTSTRGKVGRAGAYARLAISRDEPVVRSTTITLDGVLSG